MMLAREPKRRESRCRGIGAEAVALPLSSRPEASIHCGTPHGVDADLMQAEIVCAANHNLPWPKIDLPVAKEAGGKQSGQTQSNQPPPAAKWRTKATVPKSPREDRTVLAVEPAGYGLASPVKAGGLTTKNNPKRSAYVKVNSAANLDLPLSKFDHRRPKRRPDNGPIKPNQTKSNQINEPPPI
jgi:hypothetical protein